MVTVYTEQAAEFVKKQAVTTSYCLERSFSLLLPLQPPSTGPAPDMLDTETLSSVLTVTARFHGVPTLREAALASLVDRLDTDKDGYVSLADFKTLPSVLFERAESDDLLGPRFVDLWCPSWTSTRAFAVFTEVVESPYFEYFIDFFILLNFTGNAVVRHLSDGDHLILALEWGAVVLFTLEMTSKLVVRKAPPSPSF